MKYLIGVDFGGGSSKATLLREDGFIVATATKEYPTFYPNNGWAEQKPEDSYQAFVANVRAVMQKGMVAPEDVVAICLDAATHTAVLLDEEDQVIRDSIYWTDSRSQKEVAFLKEHYEDKIYTFSHNIPNEMWTLPHLMWLKEHEKENFDKIHKIMFVKDYVRYRLTGDFVTDNVEAMGSMFMDVPNNCWSDELCAMAGITKDMLPKIVDPQTILSPICEQACKETGLSPNTKVIAGSTDTVMEVYANGAIHQGQMTIKLATAGRICPITDRAQNNKRLVNYQHLIPGLWYPGTGTKSCAASYRWYRDILGKGEMMESEAQGIDAYEWMNREAEKVAPLSDNLYFHPYLQGELTPYFDASLRGSFTGIRAYHTKGHFTRALLEGVAYSLKDCYQVIQAENLDIHQAIVIGGGAKGTLWRQIVSDVLGIEMMKTKNNDSSLGSAMLAGVATGVFGSFEESVAKCVETEAYIKPDMENHKKYEKGFQRYKKIHDALADIYKEMEEDV